MDGYNPNLLTYDGTRGGHPFLFTGSNTGTYIAAFVQDTSAERPDGERRRPLRPQRPFRVRAPARAANRRCVSPQATNTVFRASYNRMFITPEYENILISSSQQAASITPPDIQDSAQLGGGQLYNLSERHDAWNFGVQQGIGSKLRFDGSLWYRRVHNAADQDQFFNTGIVFPLNFATGDLQGWNLRLDLAPVLGGLRGYASVGHVHAEYCNPFVGGLFLSSDALGSFQGGCFLIDHDQDIQEQVGLFYDLGKTGFWAGMTQRYDSGLVTDAGAPADVLSSPDTAYALPYIHFNQDPQRVASRTVWSFSLGARLQPYGIPAEVQTFSTPSTTSSLVNVCGRVRRATRGSRRYERRHEEDADEEPREEPADDDQGERPLRIGADAGRDRRRQQAEGRHERRHHDRAEPQDRGLARRLDDAHAPPRSSLT
jgi:hypothetical protein